MADATWKITQAERDRVKEIVAGLAFICEIRDTGQLVDAAFDDLELIRAPKAGVKVPITAAMVQQLSTESDRSMMECKRALADANGDMQAAKQALRLNNLASTTAEIDRDTDGELLIDWSPSPSRMLTLSLRADGRLSYAITWDGEKSHGTAQMPAGVLVAPISYTDEPWQDALLARFAAAGFKYDGNGGWQADLTTPELLALGAALGVKGLDRG